MGYERPRRRASGDGLHHRGLDLDVSVGVEEAADRLHHLAAPHEHLAHLGVHRQIHVTLPVAQFHVGEPVPFLRQGQQVLGKKRQLLDVDRQFAGAGAEQESAHPDVVADIEQLPELESGLAQVIFLDVDLQPLPALLQVGESCLAHQADGHDASGDAHLDFRTLELFGGAVFVVGQDLRNLVRGLVFVRIGALAQRFDLLELLPAKLIDVLVERHSGMSNSNEKAGL